MPVIIDTHPEDPNWFKPLGAGTYRITSEGDAVVVRVQSDNEQDYILIHGNFVGPVTPTPALIVSLRKAMSAESSKGIEFAQEEMRTALGL